MASAMVWALSRAGRMAIHITEARSGLDCDCICPGCDATLEAVNSQNPDWKRRPHFRHQKSDELKSCGDAAFVAAIKSCISEMDEFVTPACENTAEVRAPGGRMVNSTLSSEESLGKVVAYEFVDVTDAVLTLENGQQIYVRLIASGRFDGTAKQGPLAEIVIDLTDPVLRTADRATLRRHISLGAERRTWCRNQVWDVKQAEAKRLADVKASEYLTPPVGSQILAPVGQYRYVRSASWWQFSEKLLADVRTAMPDSPQSDAMYRAVVKMVRQPTFSPVDFAVRREADGISREVTLGCLHTLRLVVRGKVAESTFGGAKAAAPDALTFNHARRIRTF